MKMTLHHILSLLFILPLTKGYIEKNFYKLDMVLKLGSYQDSKVINKTRNNFLGLG